MIPSGPGLSGSSLQSEVDALLSSVFSDDYGCTTETETPLLHHPAVESTSRYGEFDSYLKTLQPHIKVGILKNRFNYPNDVANIILRIRKVAIAICKDVLFGTDEMKKCTLKGRNMPQLNQSKTKILENIIRLIIDYRTENEFQLYWRVVNTGISQA